MPAGALIVITGALYFADRGMKLAGNYFRGFPALWNAVAFYLFCSSPAPWLAFLAIVVALAVLTFASFKFLHPVRVRHLRPLNIAALILWSAFAFIARHASTRPGALGDVGGYSLIGLYFFLIGFTDRAKAAVHSAMA